MLGVSPRVSAVASRLYVILGNQGYRAGSRGDILGCTSALTAAPPLARPTSATKLQDSQLQSGSPLAVVLPHARLEDL